MAYTLPPYIVALDVESSDLSPDKPSRGATLPGQCISIAIELLDTRTLRTVERFYTEIRFDPTRFNWSVEAAAVHGLSIQGLADKPTLAEAGHMVIAFIEKHLGLKPKILVAAHNPNFDAAYLRQVLTAAGYRPALITRQVDAFTAGFVAFDLASSDAHVTFLGRSRAKHDAREDIANSVEMLRRVRAAGTLYRNRWYWLAGVFTLGLLLGALL
jgi:DNA polymerase III epsilon subunit-like protein